MFTHLLLGCKLSSLDPAVALAGDADGECSVFESITDASGPG
jgi:hypothetical protein